ncbi:MAG: PfkB family carbohydrate kinase [Chthoniobacteraceae bacterium]
MPVPSSLPSKVAARLKSSPSFLESTPVLVGFDGFVDTILHVVRTRESATKFLRLDGMRDFAGQIDAAAGLSGNVELVTQMVKLGGNGPIMANALGAYGLPMTYLGNLGCPNLHPVFAEFARRAAVHSIAEPGYTDAIEFDDGKLMLGKHESLKDVNWNTIIKYVPEPQLVRIFQNAKLIALVNWTMLPHMSAIFRKLLSRVAPTLKGPKRWLFIDLADPAKRSSADIAEALKLVTKFQKFFRVILGLNLNESCRVGEVLGIERPEETYGTVTHHAEQLQAALKIETVVIHPTQFAAAADSAGCTHVVGSFTARPKITTGAGDHFNAGFCVGRLLGLDLAESLQVGVATSGYYVRHAKSPALREMIRFLRTL